MYNYSLWSCLGKTTVVTGTWHLHACRIDTKHGVTWHGCRLLLRAAVQYLDKSQGLDHHGHVSWPTISPHSADMDVNLFGLPFQLGCLLLYGAFVVLPLPKVFTYIISLD
jgi:hypothetical protein